MGAHFILGGDAVSERANDYTRSQRHNFVSLVARESAGLFVRKTSEKIDRNQWCDSDCSRCGAHGRCLQHDSFWHPTPPYSPVDHPTIGGMEMYSKDERKPRPSASAM